ncbi:MAG: helix-turn-helix transcriptional regulator [Bacteriovoracaceae bacterium]|nr:helix-turn-helix transcriptional regulator [Bacteriovoracaceae bacterium]
MSEHMRRRLTKDDITILVRGTEIELKSSIKASLANIINELIDFDSFTAEEVHGEWLISPLMRVAKYLKGARKREGLTQAEVCKKLKIQQGNLSKMENGERPIPESLISKLASLYNIKKKMITQSQVIQQVGKKKL